MVYDISFLEMFKCAIEKILFFGKVMYESSLSEKKEICNLFKSTI